MGAIASFDFDLFTAGFPEFIGIGPALGQSYFNRAATIHANDGTGPVADAPTQQSLLFLLTAHIAWLNAPRDGNGNPAASGVPAASIVGRIQSANEGSVSVSAENSYPQGTAQWFQQTRYGTEYWTAMAGLRTMQYRRGPVRRFYPPFVYPYFRG